MRESSRSVFAKIVLFGFASVSLLPACFAAAEYSEEPEVLRDGKALFRTYCAACHDLSFDVIGPALGSVTGEVDKDWLLRFVSDPQLLVDQGDERAVELVERYKVVMPSFGLSDAEIESILAYLHSRRERSSRQVAKRERSGGLADPIPEKIQQSGIGLDLELAWQIPASDERHPLARINKLAAVRDSEVERLFVNDQRGYLYELKEDGPQLVLDLGKVKSEFISEPGLATGFSSFAFSPDFESSGLFYTQHAERPDAGVADFALPKRDKAAVQYVVTEWKMDPADRDSVLGAGRELLRMEMIDTSHGMQEIAFNSSAVPGDADFGLLYIGVGDGGASYMKRIDLIGGKRRVWGTILRIDPRGRDSANGRYGIPSINPFVSGKAAFPEVFATGFRNPNTLTWSSDGSLYASDIGHWNIEEVNRVEAGKDYGWPRFEGRFKIDLLKDSLSVFAQKGNAGFVVEPLVQVDHDELRAIAGGYVYEGDALPLLKGLYLFGGIATGRVFAAEVTGRSSTEAKEVRLFHNGKEVTLSELVGVGRADLRIGQGRQGEPYILSKSDGTIWKIVGARVLEH